MQITISLVSATEDGSIVSDIIIETRDLDKRDPRIPGDVVVTGASQADAIDLLRIAAGMLEGSS
jgi:hypothetical protein